MRSKWMELCWWIRLGLEEGLFFYNYHFPGGQSYWS
jgi:hypothetical protein